MKILLIGNFAPPYEEENLNNLSLLHMLEKDGHDCTVINVSVKPSAGTRFIDAKSVPGFALKLLRHCRGKDVVHFSTKGYLRVGLLKLMASIFIGKLLRARTVITFHSELFSILGQMRSPFGGTQTLNTSFFLVDKVIFNDKDTLNVASMYMKKPNFELVPSFVQLPEENGESPSSGLGRVLGKEKLIFFSNVRLPSFTFDILTALLSGCPVSSDIGIVISFSDKPDAKMLHAIRDTGRELMDSTVFLEHDNLQETLTALSSADLIIRPLSCDGEMFFESFSLSVKKVVHSGNRVSFPGGLILVKEGRTANMCVDILVKMLSSETDFMFEETDPYKKIMAIYEE